MLTYKLTTCSYLDCKTLHSSFSEIVVTRFISYYIHKNVYKKNAAKYSYLALWEKMVTSVKLQTCNSEGSGSRNIATDAGVCSSLLQGDISKDKLVCVSVNWEFDVSGLSQWFAVFQPFDRFLWFVKFTSQGDGLLLMSLCIFQWFSKLRWKLCKDRKDL